MSRAEGVLTKLFAASGLRPAAKWTRMGGHAGPARYPRGRAFDAPERLCYTFSLPVER